MEDENRYLKRDFHGKLNEQKVMKLGFANEFVELLVMSYKLRFSDKRIHDR
jgi:hypothetical protein